MVGHTTNIEALIALDDANPSIHITALAPTAREYTSLQRGLSGHSAEHITIVLESNDYPLPGAPFIAALLDTDGCAVRGNAYTRGVIERLAAATAPSGQMYLEGSTHKGIQTFAGMLEMLGAPPRLEGRAPARRLYAATRPAMLPVPEPLPSHETTVTLRGITVTLRVQEGVFSGRAVDAGTRLLLEHLSIVDGESFLDLGCGSGIVGIIAAKLAPRSRIVMTDASPQAIVLARHNTRANNLDNVSIILSDVYEGIGHDKFNVIAINPPFHGARGTTRRIALEMIQGASTHLTMPQGRVYVVGNSFQAYESALYSAFSAVERLAQTNRYIVWLARSPQP
ncbi:MAG: methyltransferase [Chloroflexi bacterium]|nr:methyltransferase [Chloroflexota bacterium]